MLSAEQHAVYESVVTHRRNAFITGSAGTGKSYLIRKILEALPDHGLHVTASTGVAALLIEGGTLHSFAGCGLIDEEVDHMCRRMYNAAKQRWLRARTLVVDEISMISAATWDKLEAVARQIRKKPNLPFGGIQLICCGDFLQLPPVAPESPDRVQEDLQFAFQAKSWAQCFPPECRHLLRHVFRQEDVVFAKLLNELRVGHCSEQSLQIMRGRVGCRLAAEDAGIQATKLFSRRRDVDRLNEEELARIDAPVHTFEANDKGDTAMMNKRCLAPEVLNLKVGAQVMLLKNLDVAAGLVNGSRGVVDRFASTDDDDDDDDEEEGPPSKKARTEEKEEEDPPGPPPVMYPVVRFVSGAELLIAPSGWEIKERREVVASRLQVPLQLAWAMTIHKCQGMSIDAGEVDLEGTFTYGQVYVALSRMRSLEGLRLKRELNPKLVRAAPEALKWYADDHPQDTTL